MANLKELGKKLSELFYSANNVVSAPFNRIGADVSRVNKQIPQNQPAPLRFAQALPTAMKSVATQIPGVSQVAGYGKYRIAQPVENLGRHTVAAVNPFNNASLGQRAMSGVNAGLSGLGAVWGLNPLAISYAGFDAAKGAWNAKRTGQDPIKAASQGFTGEKVMPLGNAVVGDKSNWTKPLNYAEMVAPLVAGGVQALRNRNAVRNIQPPNMHPEDVNVLDRATDIIRDKKASPQIKKDAKDYLYKLAEHYIPKKELPESGDVNMIIRKLQKISRNENAPYMAIPGLGITEAKQYGKFAQSPGGKVPTQQQTGSIGNTTLFPSVPNLANSQLSDKATPYANNIPQAGSAEQLLESSTGWAPGMRKQFDTALFSKNKEAVQKLLPQVPDEYKARFANEIDDIIGGAGKQRGFVTSVKEAAGITHPTKTNVAGTYTPKPNTDLMGEAKALLSEGASIKIKHVQGIDKKIAATIQEAINLDKSGNHEAAANLFNNLSEQGTELGRGVQAFSMIDKMSPEAIALSAAGKIKAYNRTASRPIPELGGEQLKIISDQVAKIDGLTGRDKNIAINELQNTINSFIPSTLADKAITVWKAGLLTSLRTHERNLLGNTIMNVSEGIKDIPASIADQLMSLRTGKRSITLTGKGAASGAAKGVQSAKDMLTKGYDPEQSIANFDVKQVNWGKNPVEQVLKKYTDTVFRTLGAADKPFWSSSFARSLHDQAGAEAINAGRHGDGAFIQNLVNNPTEQMLLTATKDANYATFKDKNTVSSIANAVKRELGKNELTKVLGEVVAPFTGVPSSVVGKTIAYSPIGFVKGVVIFGRVIVGNVPELQRQAAQEVGRGVVGTGLFGLGAYLMSKGLMTGQPKDQKEADLWAAEGKQANSILIDGKWRSIGSIGPQSIVALAGAKFQEEANKPNPDYGAFAAGLGKDQLSQTFLAGVQGPLNAISDPARYGQSYVGNQSTSVIPNIVKDIAKSQDTNVRETNSVGDYFKAALPGYRNSLLPKRDVLGNALLQEPTGAAAFVDLFNSKTPISNTVVDELSRLNAAGNNSVPSKLAKSQTIGGVKTTLSPEQLDSLERFRGPVLSQALDELFQSSSYKMMSDQAKGEAIDKTVLKINKYMRGETGAPIFKDAQPVAKKTSSKSPSIKVKKEPKTKSPKKGPRISIKTSTIKPTKTIRFKISKPPKQKSSKNTFKITKAKKPPKFKLGKTKLRFSPKFKLK